MLVTLCFPRFFFVKLAVLLSPSVFYWVLRGVPNGLGGLAVVLMDGMVVRHITVGWFGFCLTVVMLLRQYVGVTDLSVSMGFTGGGVVEHGGRDLVVV
ncbi:hypothetical protein RHMOL_Rhmol09G0256700 [Rhododendron molle]|uniref:Uncharacterized protein n=1 Tax=Rhododendron molle TaxID=49168 RepID=A0ACC0MH48_RHOML|nr:hypothetical protein RHMOL_Rhmol09G0256700 [Rhododendron molle]